MSEFFSDMCSVVASLMMLAVLVTYLKQLVEGSSTPNPATWFIWASVGIINSITYFYTAREELFQFLTTAVAAMGLCIIFIYALYRGRIGKVELTEKVSFLLAAVVMVIWRVSGDPVMANLSLQVVYFVSFIPTVKGLLEHRLKEKPLPWDLAVIAYSFMILAVLLRWGIENPEALAFPIVNGIIGNGIVSVIVHTQLRTKKPR